MTKILASAFALLMSASSVFAADLYQPEPAPPVDPVEVAPATMGGWYLRGDGSYDYNHMRGAHYFQGSNATLADFDKTNLRSSYNLGLGIGYQADQYMRFDTTLDYMFKAKFRGQTSSNFNCGQGGPGCVSTDLASMAAMSLMANAYVDLMTVNGITAYVGAGLGGTHIAWTNLRNTACTGNNCASSEHEGKESWRFTYALMAGMSYDVTCNVKTDVGYRYRHVAGGDMFGYKNNGGPGFDKGFDIHEGRLGLRYNFDGCQEASYMPPAEIPQQPAVYK